MARKTRTSIWPWLIGGTVGISTLWWLAKPAQAKSLIVADTCALVESLQQYLTAGGNFGSKTHQSPEVAEVQRALQLADDGILGPITRDIAEDTCSIMLPMRRGGVTDTQGSGKVAYVGMTGPDAQSTTVAVYSQQRELVAEVPSGHKGSLAALVTIKLGAIAKMAAPSIPSLEAKTTAFLLNNRNKLAQCPGAPHLVRTPSVVIRDISGGFSMQVRWPAQWASASKRVPSSLRSCMERLLRNDPKAGPYISSVMISRS